MNLKHLYQAVLATTVISASGSIFAQSSDSAICYNCPPEWADWGTQLRLIEQETGIRVPQDNKNSGQSLAQLVAEAGSPVADVVYYGVTFGIQAMEEDVVAPYQPEHWDEIPEGLKDPEGNWFAIHSGTLGFMVNVDALDGAPVPTSWSSLSTRAWWVTLTPLAPLSATWVRSPLT